MCEDPLTAAIRFERRFDALMKYVINSQEHPIGKVKDFFFIQYFAQNWPWYRLRGLHIRITWFSPKTKWYGTTFGNCFDNVQLHC